MTLMDTINETRLRVWAQQPPEFFEEAILDVDGTIVATDAECKQGVDIAYNGSWGYHPLLISLANTAEPLFLVNRSGNRPSHEQAAVYLDKAINLCRRAGFRQDHPAGRHRLHPDQASGPLGRGGRRPLHLRVRHQRGSQSQSRETPGRGV